MYYLLLGLIILGVLYYKPSRFYLMSFIFPWLYDHPWISKLLGIQYKDDTNWKTNRKETYVYMKGFFVWIFTKFSGMNVILSDHVRKSTMRLQRSECDKFDMTRYFDEINGKTITLEQFEDYLAGWILKESNRVFQIIDNHQEDILYQHVKIIKSMINSLLGNIFQGLWIIIRNFTTVIKMSKILHTVPEDKRLFLFVPQLTLVSNFVRTIVKTKGDFSNVYPHDFLESSTKFSVLMMVIWFLSQEITTLLIILIIELLDQWVFNVPVLSPL